MSEVDSSLGAEAFERKLQEELERLALERREQMEAAARNAVAVPSRSSWDVDQPSVDVEGVPLPPPFPTPPQDGEGKPLTDSPEYGQALTEWEGKMEAHPPIDIERMKPLSSVIAKPSALAGAVGAPRSANEMLGAYFLMQAASKRGTVARLAIHHKPPKSGGPGRDPTPLGTGFLIGPCMLMTNAHVLSEWMAHYAAAEFDYVLTDGGKTLVTQVHRLDPKQFYVASPPGSRLDYAVVYVEPVSLTGGSLLLRGWNPISHPETPKPGNRVNIVQHPGGSHQQVALRDNQVISCPRRRHMHYLADTLEYSSGSPVWDDRWRLVGLHHAALPKWTNHRGQILVSRGGTVWNGESPPEGEIEWRANEGVRVSKIVTDLKQRVKVQTDADTKRRGAAPPPKDQLSKQDLLDNCFEAPPPLDQLTAANAFAGVMGVFGDGTQDGVDLGRYDPVFGGTQAGDKTDRGGSSGDARPIVPNAPPIDRTHIVKTMRAWAAFD